MNTPHPEKFGFKVRTRNGAIVEKVLISGESEQDARTRLFQMYYQCEVLSSWQESQAPRLSGASFEEVADLINR